MLLTNQEQAWRVHSSSQSTDQKKFDFDIVNDKTGKDVVKSFTRGNM